jgi:hypothetical protein
MELARHWQQETGRCKAWAGNPNEMRLSYSLCPLKLMASNGSEAWIMTGIEAFLEVLASELARRLRGDS